MNLNSDYSSLPVSLIQIGNSAVSFHRGFSGSKMCLHWPPGPTTSPCPPLLLCFYFFHCPLYHGNVYVHLYLCEYLKIPTLRPNPQRFLFHWSKVEQGCVHLSQKPLHCSIVQPMLRIVAFCVDGKITECIPIPTVAENVSELE